MIILLTYFQLCTCTFRNSTQKSEPDRNNLENSDIQYKTLEPTSSTSSEHEKSTQKLKAYLNVSSHIEEAPHDALFLKKYPKLKSFIEYANKLKTCDDYLSISKQINEVNKNWSESETKEAFQEIKKLFTLTADGKSHPKFDKKNPIDDFKKNGMFYVWEFIDKRAESILEEFLEAQINEKDETKSYEIDLRRIYHKREPHHFLEMELRYLEHRLIGFMVDKFKTSTDENMKDLILDILRVFCQKLQVPINFTEIMEKYHSKDKNKFYKRFGNKQKDYLKLIKNSAFRTDLMFIDHITQTILLYSRNNIDVPNNNFEFQLTYYEKQFAEFNFSLKLIHYNFETLRNWEKGNEEVFLETNSLNEFKSKLFILTGQLLSIHRCVLENFFNVANELKNNPVLIADDGNKESVRCYCYVKTLIYCYKYLISIIILHENLPVNFRTACYHRTISLINKFYHDKKISDQSDTLQKDPTNYLLLEFGNLISKFNNHFSVLTTRIKQEPTEPNIPRDVFFYTSCLTCIRIEFQHIIHLNFLSLKDKLVDENKSQKNEKRTICENLQENKENLDKNIFEAIFYSYKKSFTFEKSRFDVKILFVDIIINFIRGEKNEQPIDLAVYSRLEFFDEFFTETEFDILRYDFTDTENFRLYDILYSEIGKMFVNHSDKGTGCENSTERESFSIFDDYFESKNNFSKKLENMLHEFGRLYYQKFKKGRHVLNEILFIKSTLQYIQSKFELYKNDNLLLTETIQILNYFDNLKILLNSEDKCLQKVKSMDNKNKVYITEIFYKYNRLVFCFVLITDLQNSLQSVNPIYATENGNIVRNKILIDVNDYESMKIQEIIESFNNQFINQKYILSAENMHLSYDNGFITTKFYIFRHENEVFFDFLKDSLWEETKKLGLSEKNIKIFF